MMPVAPEATVYRPWSKPDIVILNPSPSSPMRLATGTLTSVNEIQPVEPARTPSLPCRSPVLTPALCRSTMNDDSPSDGFRLDEFVLTVTNARSALEAREIHIFSP